MPNSVLTIGTTVHFGHSLQLCRSGTGEVRKLIVGMRIVRGWPPGILCAITGFADPPDQLQAVMVRTAGIEPALP